MHRILPFVAKHLSPGNVQRMKLVYKNAKKNMNRTVNVNAIRNRAIAAKKNKNNAIRHNRTKHRMSRGRQNLEAHGGMRVMMKKSQANANNSNVYRKMREMFQRLNR
jgi:hypothetical protein